MRFRIASRSFAAVVTATTVMLTAATPTLAASSGGARPPGAAPADGNWGAAQEIAADLNTGGAAEVLSVSCASGGNCAAGGTYGDNLNRQAFVAEEVDGTWGAAQEVPGTADLNTGGIAQVTSVSCASKGNCAAVGYYTDSTMSPFNDIPGSSQAFVAEEVKGTWGAAQEIPGTADLNTGGIAQATSVSCASKGNCAAVGYYTDSSGHRQAFVAEEVKGTWGAAQEIAADLNAGEFAQVTSVSCAARGNCAAVGSYNDSSFHVQVFVATEVKGTWGAAQEIPGTADLNAGGIAQATSVSCAARGNCAAVGYYTDSSGHRQAFVAEEAKGTWGAAQEIPGTADLNAGGLAQVTSVSCASKGNCAAVGNYLDSSHKLQVFVATEVDGTWGAAQEIPGTADLNAGGFAQATAVSCASKGKCAAVGNYSDSSLHAQVFVATEVKGTWGAAQQIPGTADLNADGNAQVASVSCGSAGNCAAGGTYVDSAGDGQAFVVSQT